MEVVIEELDKKMNRDKSRDRAKLEDNGTIISTRKFISQNEPINVMNK